MFPKIAKLTHQCQSGLIFGNPRGSNTSPAAVRHIFGRLWSRTFLSLPPNLTAFWQVVLRWISSGDRVAPSVRRKSNIDPGLMVCCSAAKRNFPETDTPPEAPRSLGKSQARSLDSMLNLVQLVPTTIIRREEACPQNPQPCTFHT